ncbi:MAG: phospho-N-acetylmuramoyl-pentapeptide-transferase [Synergistetes bacterium]|nr:phospho-N-acetylmuramoyl-pentapeptide-transferase [Synergistota bacterium]MCX8127786.1 phospho-N-acetylmuramoyl-pentapeptide-transferase [Synergistota bacterium]MDW8192048.1 phospho-N-acetylmuramoyl-pentapeptide-transferase [Synergistota bacterium]
MLKAFTISLFISLFLGYLILAYLKKFSIWQPIKNYGPKNHFVKTGTPTMGGISFVLSFLIGVFLLMDLPIKEVVYIVISGILCSFVGLIDDIVKVKKRTDGVKPRKKLFLQSVVALFCLIFLFKSNLYDPEVFFPFMFKVNFGEIYSPFVIFLFLACMNAVNITDGLDGLACGSSIIAFSALLIISLLQGKIEIAILILILIGSLVGFLYYNRYPAKMFMGDMGAMFLGGVLASLGLVLKVEILMPFICGIFLIDTLSVIIQIASYKFRKKRVFLMSPLHHHFELKGWKEQKVVKFFWSIELGLSILGVMFYKFGW